MLEMSTFVVVVVVVCIHMESRRIEYEKEKRINTIDTRGVSDYTNVSFLLLHSIICEYAFNESLFFITLNDL